MYITDITDIQGEDISYVSCENLYPILLLLSKTIKYV